MIDYILWALLLYLAYIFTPALMRLVGNAQAGGGLIKVALGSRDEVKETSIANQRAARAQKNMEESLFLFLPVALLLLYTEKGDGLASAGAGMYVVARALYLPAYIMGVPGLRTLVWTASFAGIIMMIVRLHG